MSGVSTLLLIAKAVCAAAVAVTAFLPLFEDSSMGTVHGYGYGSIWSPPNLLTVLLFHLPLALCLYEWWVRGSQRHRMAVHAAQLAAVAWPWFFTEFSVIALSDMLVGYTVGIPAFRGFALFIAASLLVPLYPRTRAV